MTNYFITFGSNGYERALNRICKQASEFEIFSNIKSFHPKDLYDYEDFKIHSQFISSHPRLYGYGVWKPFIIEKTLEIMKEDDILLYCDAGCELKVSGKKRMMEYLEMVKNSESGILAFQLPFEERRFTKMNLLHHLNFNNENDLKSLHNLSGIIFFRKCKTVMQFIRKWHETNCIYHLVDDSPSDIPNDPKFETHRHDQSVFSILSKQYKASMLKDETFISDTLESPPKWLPEYPIWACRNRYN